jgi:hypothetical protein
VETIQHFLSASILAGLTVFVGLFALGRAIYSVIPSGSFRRWLDRNLVRKFRGGLKLETFKENSLLLTLAVVLIYPVGDATLHIIDDVFEDRLSDTCFEKAGQDCRWYDSTCIPSPRDDCPADGFAPVSEKSTADERENWKRYRDLTEGNKELKFTRIGEIEAREDEIDRETIDKEKSYLHDLEIFLLLFTTISVALIIYASNALALRIVCLLCLLPGLAWLLFSVTTEPVPIIVTAAAALLDLTLLAFSVRSLVRCCRDCNWRVGEMMRERLADPSVWKPLLACGLLAVLLGGVFFIREEYQEQEDKYERLVYHVWKNHMGEKDRRREAEPARNGH